MNQKSRAMSDVRNSGWMPLNGYFSRINEPTPNDSTFVNTVADPAGQSFEVRLAPLAWPQNGSQVLTVQLSKSGTETAPVLISLFQGNVKISSKTVLATPGFVAYPLELTQAEKLAITDYTNLRLVVDVGLDACPSADELTLGVPVERELPIATSQLFRINALADTDYYVKLTVLTGDFLGAFVSTFDVGGSSHFEFFLTDSVPCGTLRKLNDFGICIQVGPDSVEDSSFMIEVGEGDCP